jgi:hypothetical protein
MLSVVILNVLILSVLHFYCYAECHYNECPYAECRYAERRYAECRYADRRYAECGGASRWRLERTPRRFPDWGVANEKLIATFDEKKNRSFYIFLLLPSFFYNNFSKDN